MAKQLRKRGERKNENSRKMRDLPAKSLGTRKAASVKGGTPCVAGAHYDKVVLVVRKTGT